MRQTIDTARDMRDPKIHLQSQAYGTTNAYTLVRQLSSGAESLLTTYARMNVKVGGYLADQARRDPVAAEVWDNFRSLDRDLVVMLMDAVVQTGLIHHWHEMHPCYSDDQLRCACAPATPALARLLDDAEPDVEPAVTADQAALEVDDLAAQAVVLVELVERWVARTSKLALAIDRAKWNTTPDGDDQPYADLWYAAGAMGSRAMEITGGAPARSNIDVWERIVSRRSS